MHESELQNVYRIFDETGSFVEVTRQTGIAKHLVIRAIYRRDSRCTSCGRPRDLAGTTCAVCLEKAKAKHVRRYREHKLAGICVYCSQPLADNSDVFCAEHLLHNRIKATELRTGRRAQSVCIDCGGEVMPGRNYCAEHFEYHRQRSRRTKMGGNWESVIVRDGGHCAICLGSSARLEVHHLDFNRMNNDPANLLTLCLPCHHALTDLVNCPDRDSLIRFVLLNYP